MDTRIWMQESFWESAEKQSVKESPQENAEHLSKDQNENGGNKPVDQKTSLWKQTYENILVGMGFCVITLNFLLLNYILPFVGILMIFAGLRKVRRRTNGLKWGMLLWQSNLCSQYAHWWWGHLSEHKQYMIRINGRSCFYGRMRCL